ncbi:ABC transporter permease [Actinomycetaceae bacterium MB13-C1-2]|nr:ABC transporter permease [Actinomycetaceae bacterium MB13-C1-2]
MGTLTHRKHESRQLAWTAPVLFALLLIAAWWLVTAFADIESWVFPSPQAFVRAAGQLLTESWFWQRVAITAGEALAGAFLGTVVAIPLAWVIYRSSIVRAAIEPFLGATQAIPAIALAPLLVLWIGHGFVAIVTLCALMVFFPVLVSTVVGLRGLDPDVLDAAAIDGADGLRLTWSVEMPMAAPIVLAGIRNGFTLSVTGAVVGEMVMGGTGLGQALAQQRYNLDTAGMFVTVGVLCLLAMTLYSLIYSVERRIKRDTRPKNRYRTASAEPQTDSASQGDRNAR